MSGLSIIQDTTSYQNLPMPRKKALDPVDVKVRSHGSIIGHSYLRSAKMRPIDVMYKQALYSNTPRIGVQNPSLPDLRYKRQGRSAGQHGGEVGDDTPMSGGVREGEWDYGNRPIPKEVLDKIPELKGRKPKRPDAKRVEETKKILKVWMKLYDQMSPQERKVVASQHKGVKRVLKMMKHMPQEALMKLRNSKTIKWLEQKEKEMKGGAHCSCGKGCMCGGSLWSDIKKGVKKVGKKVVSTGKKVVKGVKKGVKKTGKFLEKAGEVIEKGAEKTAEVAGKVAKVVSTAAEVATIVTAVVPGLEEFTPILATVAAAAEGVEKLGKEVAKHSKTAKDVGKKMSGGGRSAGQHGSGLPRPTISSSITRSTRGDDRVMFNALHPLNYKKAIL